MGDFSSKRPVPPTIRRRWSPPPGLNVNVDPVFACWLWAGALNTGGYGPIRPIWERVMGMERIPGLNLDHVCRRRACVNPRHLEPVSTSENQKRRSARYRRLQLHHCPWGHRFVPENTLHTPEDGRVCLLCMEDS